MQDFVYNGCMDAKEVKYFLANLDEEERAIYKRFSTKQRIWLEEFLKTNNQTGAARTAKYKSPAQSGQENYINPLIQRIIEIRVAKTAMEADELLEHLAHIARGFDPTDYIRVRDRYERGKGKDGEMYLVGVIVDLDLERLSADGFGDLIAGIVNTASGPRYDFIGRKDGLNPLSRYLLSTTIKHKVSYDITVEDEDF